MSRYARICIVALVPRGGSLAGLKRALIVTKLLLIYFGQSLLLASGSPEVTLCAITLDCNLDTSYGSLGVGLSVCLECVNQGVGGIVRLVEIIGEDFGCLFKGLSSFEVYCPGRLPGLVFNNRPKG